MLFFIFFSNGTPDSQFWAFFVELGCMQWLAGGGHDQENAMKGLEGKKFFGHQNCQKGEFDGSRS